MPYKDLEKRRAYAREYQKTYQPAWRASHPTYARDYLEKRYEENPRLREEYESKRDPEERRKNARAYYHRNKHKVRARLAARRAVATGQLKKPANCTTCGGTDRIQADHHDYSKPLDVTWLCHDCHKVITLWRKRNNIIL